MAKKKITLETIVIIGKLSDGTCRQLAITQEHQDVIIGYLLAKDHKLNVSNEILENLDILKSDK